MLNMRSMALSAKNAFGRFLKEENGDTNFISIIIILAIVMVVAAIFVGFKNQIVTWVKSTFTSAFTDVKKEPGE